MNIYELYNAADGPSSFRHSRDTVFKTSREKTKKNNFFQEMWVFVNLCLSFNTNVHAIFPKAESKMLIQLWKPVVVPLDQHLILSNEEVTSNFIKARLTLEHPEAFSIACMHQGQFSMMLCRSPNSCTHQIDCCLWSPQILQNKCQETQYYMMAKTMKQVWDWHQTTFIDHVIFISEDADDTNKNAWYSNISEL